MDEDRTDQAGSAWAQLPTVFSPPSSRNERDVRLTLALRRLREMGEILPKVDVGDPQRLLTTLAGVLAEYPEPVIFAVTDLTRGLPSQLKWFPTVFEMRQACEARVAVARDAEAWRADRARREYVNAKRVGVDVDREPWLRDATRELVNGKWVIPGREIDRAWQAYVRAQNRRVADARAAAEPQPAPQPASEPEP